MNLLLHTLFFVFLALMMAAAVSAYRKQEFPEIWRGTLKRFGKIVAIALVVTAVMLFIEWMFVL